VSTTGADTEVVTLERERGDFRLVVLAKLRDRRLHDGRDRRFGLVADQPVDRQHAQQPLVAVDDKHLVGLRRQLVETAEVMEHGLEGHVGPHRDVVEIHQRADHVVVEWHRSAKLFALLDRQLLKHIVHDLLREVAGELRDLVGFERLRRRDELVGIQRRDQRFADRVGHLEQDVATARSAHEVPEAEPLVERQRVENECNVGRMQALEPSTGAALLIL
jgi:hypothetical protein